jgi:serine/threonine protein kinase
MDASGHIKLSDFGTACCNKCRDPMETRDLSVSPSGTLLYMPPEGFKVADLCSHKVRIRAY